MRIRIVYALAQRQYRSTLKLAEGCTVREAIAACGYLQRFAEIDLAQQKIGIFGKFVTLDAVLHDGDRVEIYRPLTVDPKTVPKRAKAGAPTPETST